MTTPRIALFGPYALDLRSGELRKFGTKVKSGRAGLSDTPYVGRTPGGNGHPAEGPAVSGIKYDPFGYGLDPGRYRVWHFGHSTQ